MYKYIIMEYINKLTKEDIINYANKIEIPLSNKEVDIIYYYIKNEYERILNKDKHLLDEAKEELNPKAYKYLEEMYYKYEKK